LISVSVSGVRPRFVRRRPIELAVIVWRSCQMTTTYDSIADLEVKGPLLAHRMPKQSMKGKQSFRMSHIDLTSTRCSLGHGLAVERRITTALWNEQERERIIAAKAHEVFCSRGCEHGLDLDDWLKAEQELASQADDVLITQSEAGFEISIAERVEQRCIVLSIAPSNLLILWTRGDMDTSEQDGNTVHSALSLASLPETTEPEDSEVSYRDGRVWLRLPYVGNGHSASGTDTSAPEVRP
jgi:endogenous inhibitor of DNA gyrase (YacG/DUF329 family)